MCLSPNVIRAIKSRRMRYEQFESHMEEKRYVYGVFLDNPEARKKIRWHRQGWNSNNKTYLQKIG